jgi:hypothetical protein
MNKYCIKKFLAERLSEHRSTFKDTSLDEEHKEHLCTDENVQDVYNFDHYVRVKYGHPTPASPDAIFLANKKVYGKNAT